MTRNPKAPQEREATLIICSENPQAVAGQIADLTSIAHFRLLPQESQTFHDLYFDTPDGALQTQKLALRVREMGARRWITLKGGSQPTDWGGVERLEIEALWSQEALTTVVKELWARRLRIPQQRWDLPQAHPLDVMASLGMEVVQHRETHRQPRIIVSPDGSPVLAELAIDSVVYHLSGQEIRHHEVEIEAKVKGSSPVLKTVIESLVTMYRPLLRRWDHGKLATGKAIERLLSEGALEGLLDTYNNLKPGAYDRIHDYLTCRPNDAVLCESIT